MGRTKRVLVVDDIPEYLDTIEGFLIGDYEVSKARTADEARRALAKGAFDVAIVDIRLDEEDPRNRDGLVLLKQLRQDSPSTPVIVMSAYKEFDHAVEAMNAGAEYFLRKPLRPEELMEALAKLAGH